MTLDKSSVDDLGSRGPALGICWVIYGVFRVAIGIWLILFTGTATVMFGALLSRVPNPYALMADFHVFYLGLVLLAFLCGLLSVLAGLALLTTRQSARVLALVASFLSVSNVPLGTTLGIYTLIVMLRE